MGKKRVRFSVPAEFVKVWGLVVLLAAAGFMLTLQYVQPPPPRIVRIATGMVDGAYYAFAREYARLLAADGITLEIVPTAGSVENLDLLRRGEVSLGFVQGGTATARDRETLQTLGSLFLEPVWVFLHAQTRITRLAELAGRRVEIGVEGSGTAMLALQLLAVNGVATSNSVLLQHDSAEAARAVSEGTVAAAFFVGSSESPVISSLIESARVRLLDMERTTAYSRRFDFLQPVVLSEGVIDLARNIPQRDTALVAASASLGAGAGLNPSLIPALLNAATRIHSSGGLFERARQFPSVDLAALPLNEDAARYIENGPSFLFRWLPYRWAVLLDRLKLLVVPLIALLFPLFRIAPPLYQWRVRSRIYRWYAEVREIDAQMLEHEAIDAATLARRLQELEHDVASVSVPLAYAGEQYHLRLHIRLLQERLERTAMSQREVPRAASQ